MTPSPTPVHRQFWFPAKRYGWGWGAPGTWQGWVVLLVWMAAVIIGDLLLAGRHWPWFFAFIVFMAAILVGICYAKGEPPRWRWG